MTSPIAVRNFLGRPRFLGAGTGEPLFCPAKGGVDSVNTYFCLKGRWGRLVGVAADARLPAEHTASIPQGSGPIQVLEMTDSDAGSGCTKSAGRGLAALSSWGTSWRRGSPGSVNLFAFLCAH